jgi:hypothetical protein
MFGGTMDDQARPAPLQYAAREPATVGLRPARPLLFVWLPLGLLAMAVAWRGCVQYNAGAGTDLTATQIFRVVAGVNLGPFIGPLYSNSGFSEVFYRQLLPLPLALLVIGWLPFLLVRAPVGIRRALPAWVLNVLAAVAWYASALLSIVYCLN